MTVATEARDQALAAVARRAFMNRGLYMINALPMYLTVTGEQIRHDLTKQGLIAHHPNAWGALIRTALKRGYIKESGSWVQMQDKRSHARRTPLYIVSGTGK